jgi:hypothetical protein
MKEEETGWALDLVKLNVQYYLEDENLWDSLGEAYLKCDKLPSDKNLFKSTKYRY